jgi:tRNA(fMet)-specific endonuclease VapC
VPSPLYVLDTDHLSLLQRSHPRVVTRLQQLPLSQRMTTIVSAEEQLRGRFAQLAAARKVNEWVVAYHYFQQALNELMPLQLLPFDDAAAAIFLRLKATVKQVGTQDLKIAAIVLSVNSILVPRNQRDFSRVPGLVIEDWTQP